jgi:OOP family OmpA-OmpF porin
MAQLLMYLGMMKNKFSIPTKKNFMQHLLLKRISLLAVIVCCVFASSAQDSVRMYPKSPKLFSGTQGYRTWSIGLIGGGLGPALAIGGRNDYSKWKATLGYGAYIKNQLSHNFGLQLEFLKGTVSGENEKTTSGGFPITDPYASFTTDINWSGALKGVFTLGHINWSQLHTVVQPYVSLGGGLINYNPRMVTTGGANIDYKTNGSISELFIPVGLGLKFNVSNDVNLELGYSMNFIDGDNFDGYYKAPFNGDKFSFGHVGVEFALGSRSKPQLASHNAPAALAQDLWDQNAALRSSLIANEQKLNQLNQDLAGLNGLKDELNRMKLDSDKDGVADFFDKCPNTPAGTAVDGSGCALPTPPPPVVVKDTTIIKTEKYYITDEDRRIVSEAIRNLEFDFGKATIRPRSFPYLNRVAEMLVKKGFSLKLAGHTDNVGSDAANMKLSKNRAESVKSYLLQQGVNAARIEATGYGESQPIATNKTDAGRQKNRRVEFTLF